MSDIRARLGLRPVINVSGTMTYLGASIAVPHVVETVSAVLTQFVEIADLQRRASATIARLCGSEAGFVTASAAAGITLSVAAAITGDDLAAIERLPDTSGFARNEVPIQAGHMVNYGAPIEQAVRLAGARAVMVGQATEAKPYQMAGAITDRTAAVLYVVSHHIVDYGQLTLEEVAEIAHARGVPVIVDGASEYDLRGFLSRGADIAVYSAHKFLGGPTAGIVAGRRDLVRATYLQNHGIGRGMKVGKEGMAGAIAALEAWETRDHAAVRARETKALRLWETRLSRWDGVRATIVPDPTNNPLDRLEVHVDPTAARISAWDLADALAAGEPPVIVRDHEVEQGYFLLDPCNLHDGEEDVVAARMDAELDRARGFNAPLVTSLGDRRRRAADAVMRWPD